MIFREGNIARANFARAKEESEIFFATFLSFCFFFFFTVGSINFHVLLEGQIHNFPEV